MEITGVAGHPRPFPPIKSPLPSLCISFFSSNSLQLEHLVIKLLYHTILHIFELHLTTGRPLNQTAPQRVHLPLKCVSGPNTSINVTARTFFTSTASRRIIPFLLQSCPVASPSSWTRSRNIKHCARTAAARLRTSVIGFGMVGKNTSRLVHQRMRPLMTR